MATDNQQQIDDWNGAVGQRWAEMQEDTERAIGVFGRAALEQAAPRPRERVIDVGCGCGTTSLELAEAVGSGGRVLGIDVSRPMLAVARSRAAQTGLVHLAFGEADASDAPLPSDTDLVYSRFGTMFFAAPTTAFAHLRGALRPGGRCVFVCWRAPRDNPWVMAPLVAARQAVGVAPAPMDPNAPGPFAFADRERVGTILERAGFVAVEVQRFDALVPLGDSPRSAADGALRIGPTARFALEMDPAHRPAMLEAITAALTPLAAPDGSVSLNGSSWIVAASNP